MKLKIENGRIRCKLSVFIKILDFVVTRNNEFIYNVFIGCSRDSDGYYWITGRTDDLMNVSGHLLSTAQIESALIEHSSLAEAAVVGFEHSIKGNGIYCFITLKNVE